MKNIAIMCHHNADLDSMLSAYALSYYLGEMLDIKVCLVSIGLSKLSKKIANLFDIKFADIEEIDKADAIILVDTSTLKQLDKYGDYLAKIGKPIIVIDHHRPHTDTKALSSLYICDEKAKATCEIIYEMCKANNVKLNEKIASALFLGIAYETKHFALATARTIKILAELVDYGIDPQELLEHLYVTPEISERIARLKAASRLKLIKLDNWLLVISHVSSFQASVARMFIEMGADIAIVGGEKEDGKIQVSLRSSREFYNQTKIHLGEVAEETGRIMGGMGGGHPTAAGINAEYDLMASLDLCVSAIKSRLRNESDKN